MPGPEAGSADDARGVLHTADAPAPNPGRTISRPLMIEWFIAVLIRRAA